MRKVENEPDLGLPDSFNLLKDRAFIPFNQIWFNVF